MNDLAFLYNTKNDMRTVAAFTLLSFFARRFPKSRPLMPWRGGSVPSIQQAMKMLGIALVGLTLTCQANAQINLLSESRSVTIWGWAQGNGGAPGNVGQYVSYSHTLASTGGVPGFSGSLADSAYALDAVPEEWDYEMSILPHYANSRATQDSSITASLMTINASVYANIGYGSNYPVSNGGALSGANSTFEVSFSVSVPTPFEVAQIAPINSFHTDNPDPPLYDFSLVSASRGTLMDVGDFERAFFLGGPTTGILQPDVYTLRLNANALVAMDPIGDVAAAEYGIQFAVVPEAPESALLAGLAVLAGIVLKRVHKRSRTTTNVV